MPDCAVPNYSEAGHGDINPSNGTAQDCVHHILALIFNAVQKSRINTMADQDGDPSTITRAALRRSGFEFTDPIHQPNCATALA